jgi:fluoroacetyl-CoA thioesterase
VDKEFLNEESVGTKYCVDTSVKETDTAIAVGSGGLEVLATPRVASLMEAAAYKLVEGLLDEGMSTVGTSLHMNHVAATPVGMKVSATALLTGIDGRRLTFSVKAMDECELIAEGVHERFIISVEKFMNKVNGKSGSSV